MGIKISVVIITLNEEKRIKRLLNGLLEQIYKDFEIIIVDSNSNDNTEKNALEFKDKFKEFNFIKMKNRGISLGRNTGAKLAKYKDILFLDADTELDSDFIQKLIEIIKLDKIEIGTAQFKSKKQTFPYKFGLPFMNFCLKLTSLFSPTCTGSCLYSKKKVFDNLGGFDGRISLCEDSEYVKRAYKKGYKFRVLPIFCYFDGRRVEQDGSVYSFFRYIIIHLYRLLKGEYINDNTFDYKYGNYKD